MRATRRRFGWAWSGLAALLVGAPAARAEGPAAAQNLTSFGSGAVVVRDSPAYDSNWTGFWLLDEYPSTGWCSPKGDVKAKSITVEMADKNEINAVEFDTGAVDDESGKRGVKDVLVEISDQQDTGFVELTRATLARKKDKQRFVVKAPKAGRYLKLTLLNNHGDTDYMELFEFKAFGKQVQKLPVALHTGQYETDFGTFHLADSGQTAEGCYEHHQGLILNGGFDGRVLRFTWAETSGDGVVQHGPAVLLFPADSKRFIGLWWEGSSQGAPSGRWDGERKATTVGACPHWKPGQKSSLADELRASGRVRAFGITFEVDSDKLRDESRSTLEELVAVAKKETTWKFTIEGHTDNVGTDEHNQTLSNQRAEAVKAYMVKAGVAATRLTGKGLGATKPVATNDTSLGRSQNRRVEVVKE